MDEVRRHCQTMALQMGRPVSRSQRIVVSRWLVMPMAAMSPAAMSALAMASHHHAYWDDQISMASCSTQLCRG